jgi:hypothetical protein
MQPLAWLIAARQGDKLAFFILIIFYIYLFFNISLVIIKGKAKCLYKLGLSLILRALNTVEGQGI